MEAWQHSLDKWLTTPPDDGESKVHCSECGEDLYPGEKVYILDGSMYCRDCAKEWLNQFEHEITEEEAYGK